MEVGGKIEPVALSWRLRERPGQTIVELSGEIDENADFAELRRRLLERGGVLLFQLGGVRRVSSVGVREWVSFVRDLGAAASELWFSDCSPAFVTQLNMIYNFRGAAKVRSFFAPYLCERCGYEEEKLLDVATHFAGRPRVAPSFACERCGGTLELDELPERYLGFLDA